MKKLFLGLAVLMGLYAHADIKLTENFNYPDGTPITDQAAAGWLAHSGAGSGPQLVTNKTLRVVFANAEDTSVAIPGAPYNPANTPLVANIYASMTVNFESVPGSSNTVNDNFFAHFRDTSTGAAQTNGFRCRVFAYTNGAAPGMLRLGLTAVGGTVTNSDYITYPQDLATNTDYTMVLRLDTVSGNSALWINPNVETDAKVTASGPGNDVDTSFFCFRQKGSSVPGAVRVGKLKVGTAFTDVAGTNTPPAIGGLANRYDTAKNVSTGPIPFTVSDDHFPATSITVTATSSNAVYVPNANIVLGGTDTNRTITIQPGNNRESNAVINVVARNPNGASNVVHFTLYIGAPSMSTIPAQIVTQGAPPKVIPFQVSDRESAAGTLTVTATSSNPSLVPNTTAALALAANADGTNRTLTITPTAGQNGVAVITMRCTDPGNNTVTNSFSYDVAPQYGILFSDNFDSFADGTSLSQSSASQWFQFSGTLYQLIVSNKMAVINEANSEDIYAPLANAPFTTNNGAVLYYGFKLTVAKLPSAAGDYFMLLNDTTTSGFKAKAFVASGNAAPGSYRVGIANGGSAPNVEFPQDLSLNSSYYVVVRYIVGSASTTLWINPTAETSASVTALDGTPPQEIDRIALRESSLGEGIEYIDNLVASTAFTDVAPALIVNPIANRTTPVSTSTGPIPFIVTDKSVSPDTCTYGGASDNQSLVANGNITFGGSGTNRTVTIVPVAGQQGFANITINVSDTAGNANTTAFMLTVGAPATNGIVISQVYPGGGNAGATYSSKFVELFNHTANPVSLNNWSLQYAASTGSTWSAGNFANVTVAPYSYYLVALSTNGTTGAALPVTPNFTLTAINPSQAAGKIALCNSQGPLSGASPVSTPTVMDFVGYGTGTTAYEGSGPVNWTTANANAMFRASSGCVDTGDNAADFTSAAVSPRNSATAQNICVSASPTMRAFVNGNNIVIAWPSSTVGYNLETATTVNQFPWNVVGGATVVGNEYQVSVPINGGAYYRLKH